MMMTMRCGTPLFLPLQLLPTHRSEEGRGTQETTASQNDIMAVVKDVFSPACYLNAGLHPKGLPDISCLPWIFLLVEPGLL